MGGPMLNAIWVGLVVIAVVVAAFTGKMEAVSKEAFEATKTAIQTLIGLTGGHDPVPRAGEGRLRWRPAALDRARARARSCAGSSPRCPPSTRRCSAMIMNLAANMLGLGNAATPFGLKAMVELDRLNPHRGSATNAMALFLAINATAFHLMPPTGTVFVRVAAGSQAPFAIWVPTLLATLAATLTAVTVCLLAPAACRSSDRARRETWGRAAPEPTDLPDAQLPGLDAPAAQTTRWRVVFIVGIGAAALLGPRRAVGGAGPERRDLALPARHRAPALAAAAPDLRLRRDRRARARARLRRR